MKREEALELLMLLSALESWMFSVKSDPPPYLKDGLSVQVCILKDIVLEKKDEIE